MNHLTQIADLNALKLLSVQRKVNFGVNVGVKDKVRQSSYRLSSLIRFAGQANFDDKDTVIQEGMKRLASVSTDELLSLRHAAYWIASSMPMTYMTKISDLTVANALKIAETYSYEDKDKFLLRATDLVTDLSLSNAQAFSKAAYGAQDQILKRAFARIQNSAQ